eukprot:Clim_evm20s5 gene=Clim_evmTU20s5
MGKEIKHAQDLARWQDSEAYHKLLAFIAHVNERVAGRPYSQIDKASHSKAIDDMCALLNTMKSKIDDFPPIAQPMRFGNKAFRSWHEWLLESAEDLLKNLMPEELHANIPELKPYLTEGFGNETRIDYGTGHELSFIALLCNLTLLGFFEDGDYAALMSSVFRAYLDLMRHLQRTYMLEPAGSRGVWGLDDYQFVPFIWGSAQLRGHDMIKPDHFTDPAVVKENYHDYMFLECIHFIDEMKTGPFAEHSRILWDISAVPNWKKVNQGLTKMYKEEVLHKFPVVQHFNFSTLLPITPTSR